jgi:hypothetical protein
VQETAEQSLQLLEQELRRKVEQVETMAQKASAAGRHQQADRTLW